MPEMSVALEKYIDKLVSDLERYIDKRIEDLEKKVCSALKDVKESLDAKERFLDKRLDLASGSLEKRLEGMNDLRKQLDHQAANFITRTEYALQVDKYDWEVRGLRESRALLEGKASQRQVNLALILTVASLIIAVCSMVVQFINH